MKQLFHCLLFICFFVGLCMADEALDNAAEANKIYSSLSNLCNPTLADYQMIQEYLTHGNRSMIKRLQDYEPNARHFTIIGKTPQELPKAGMIPVNCTAHEKENCLIVYASFNKNYPRGLKRLVKLISDSDFQGHILYRLGGWPDVAGGSLRLAHVPYAFKVSFFKEAQRLGYKRALWLDTAIVPVISLNEIFKIIEDKGYFIMGNSHMVGPYMHPSAADSFGMTLDSCHHIPSCSAGICGLDFTHDTGNSILFHWFRAAENPNAFYSPRSDQNALSIILYALGITDLIPIKRLAHNKNEINKETLLLIEREFVNELSLK